MSDIQRYFSRPIGSFPTGRDGERRSFEELTFTEYYSLFRMEPYSEDAGDLNTVFLPRGQNGMEPDHIVVRRGQEETYRGGHNMVDTLDAERHFLKTLLQCKPGRSYEEFKTVNVENHATFRDACLAGGLFLDSREARLSLEEGIENGLKPEDLRVMFAGFLQGGYPEEPRQLWEDFKVYLCADFASDSTQTNALMPEIRALRVLDNMFRLQGLTVGDFGLSEPPGRDSGPVAEAKSWDTMDWVAGYGRGAGGSESDPDSLPF